jgi:hypothetical protein
MGIGFQIFKKTTGILLGFVAIVILIAFGVFWWSAETMCGNREISLTPIPGTKYKVVVFERDCGATSGFSTLILIFAIMLFGTDLGFNSIWPGVQVGAATGGLIGLIFPKIGMKLSDLFSNFTP